MVRNFALRTSEWSERILCYYQNTSNQLQVARLKLPAGQLFERIVFPGQRFLFESLPDATLEILTQTTQKLIQCGQLQVCETPYSESKVSHD